MPNTDALSPYDELDALVREAMGETLQRAWPEPFAGKGDRTAHLSERQSNAALRGYGQQQP
jgi:hypothetical protein